MYKKMLAIMMLCSVLLSGCAYNTDVIVNSDGNYTVDIKETSGDNTYKEQFGVEPKADDFLSFKLINEKGILFKVKDGIKFDKGVLGCSMNGNSVVYSVESNTVTVTLPKEAITTNGVVDTQNKNKVVFDLTKNLGTYYAFTDDTNPESNAPVIKGFDDGSLYTNNVTVSADDDTNLFSLTLNG